MTLLLCLASSLILYNNDPTKRDWKNLNWLWLWLCAIFYVSAAAAMIQCLLLCVWIFIIQITIKKKSGRRRVMKEKKREWSELVKIEQRSKVKYKWARMNIIPTIVWWFPFDVMVLQLSSPLFCMNWNFAFKSLLNSKFYIQTMEQSSVFIGDFYFTLRLLLSNSNNHKNSLLDYHFKIYLL